MKLSYENLPLAALVCGFEHSGTTLVSEILRQHPMLDSGFEGGLLLNDEARDFLITEPYYTNIKSGWKVSDQDLEFICSADTWPEVYTRLRDRAPIINDKNTWLFDKTPIYMQRLSEVLRRVPEVPCIVIIRDVRSILWSSYKRTNLPLDIWKKELFEVTCEHIVSYLEGLKAALSKGFEDRILIIKYENLCLNRTIESDRIFKFLNLSFSEDFLSFKNLRYEFVYGDSISNKYMKEFQGKLPEYACAEALKMMREYSTWFY